MKKSGNAKTNSAERSGAAKKRGAGRYVLSALQLLAAAGFFVWLIREYCADEIIHGRTLIYPVALLYLTCAAATAFFAVRGETAF